MICVRKGRKNIRGSKKKKAQVTIEALEGKVNAGDREAQIALRDQKTSSLIVKTGSLKIQKFSLGNGGQVRQTGPQSKCFKC